MAAYVSDGLESRDLQGVALRDVVLQDVPCSA